MSVTHSQQQPAAIRGARRAHPLVRDRAERDRSRRRQERLVAAWLRALNRKRR